MTIVVAALAVVVTAWFGAGTVWNIRKGGAVMRWMQQGLPLLGERTTLRWLGSTAVELCIHQAVLPFAQVTLLIFLEPRDVPWWGLSRSLGRRDTLIIRAQLRRPPKAELEALEPASWSGRDALRRMATSEWTLREPAGPGTVQTWYRTPAALGRADALLELAQRSGMTVRRLSVRQSEPHFQLHVAPPPAETSAQDFFAAVRALGERATT